MRNFQKVVVSLLTVVLLFGLMPQQVEAAGLINRFRDFIRGGDTVSVDGRAMADRYGLPYSGMENDPFITVTRFHDASAIQVSADNPFVVAMEAITNIRIETEYRVGDTHEKIRIMVASGDLPDMVQVGVGEQPIFFNAGVYMPLQDLVEQYAPNYRKQFDQYWPYMFTADGNKYVMSCWGTPSGVINHITYNGSAFWMQKAVLDYYGRAPKTVEEYFDFIRGYKEAHPTIDGVPTIGFEICNTDWRVWPLMAPGKFLMGYGNWGDVGMPDLVNNRALDPYAEDWYYDYVRLLNQEFHKGTILSETFTRDHDQYVATLASGAVLGVFDQEWNFGAARDLLLQEGRIERTFLPIALTWDESIAPHYIDNLSFTANNGFGISVNSRHAERIMKLVDYIIQEDVQKWLSWGIEGEHYSVRNGRYIRSFEQRRRQTDDPQWVRDNMGRWYRDMFPKIDGSFPNGNATGPGGQDEEAWATLPDYDRDLFTKLGISSRIGLMGAPVDVPVWYPFWGKRSFTEGDGTAASIAWENQRWFMIENQPQLVIAPQGQFESRLRTFRDNLARVDVQPALDQLNIDIQNILRMAE